MRPDDRRLVSNLILQPLKGDNITTYGDGAQTKRFCYGVEVIGGLGVEVIGGLVAMFNGDLSIRDPLSTSNPHEFSLLKLPEKTLKD